MLKNIIGLIGCLFILSSIPSIGQDPLRFEDEVEKLMDKYQESSSEEVILFTGSSSIRFWYTLTEDFPDYNIVNTGFGGSHFSDLLHFQDSLIHKFSPQKIFIYEGDNDISFGKSSAKILTEAKILIQAIQSLHPECIINFISPKPSVARWNLRVEYESFNRQLSALCEGYPTVNFIDVWTPMCFENGEVREELFIADRLHMNKKGYDIWKTVIGPYVTSKSN